MLGARGWRCQAAEVAAPSIFAYCRENEMMSSQRLMVIGGNAAGMTAAAKARRLNKKLEIQVVEKGPHVSYAP